MDRFEFTRVFCQRPQSYAWFLGAGSSRGANLPTAEDIITDLKRRYYCSEENQNFNTKDLQNVGVRDIVESYMISRGFPERWADDEYTTYFQSIFGEDRERQRKYISGMLSEERVRLAVGNRVFGTFLASGLCRAVFSTNFDSVVEKAVAEVGGKSLSAFHLEGAEGLNSAINNEEYPVYCKLHGDFRYDSIKNLSGDLASQNENLSKGFINVVNRFGLVVAGYSGRDQSVLDLFYEALESQNPFPQGLFWTHIVGSKPSDTVTTLLEAARSKGVSAEFVEIETFDTLLLRLWRNLSIKPDGFDSKIRTGRATKVSIPVPNSNGNKPLIRYNALPVEVFPSKCLKIDLNSKPTWETITPILRQEQHQLITTIDDELLAWGPVEEIENLFSEQYVGVQEYSFEPDWRKTGRLNIKRFLEDGLTKSFSEHRPLLKRRVGSGSFLIVDKMTQDIGVFQSLYEVVGNTSGEIRGLSIPATESHDAVQRVEFSESVQVSLTWVGDKLWMQLKPDIWIWPKFARRHATQFLDKRRANRRNDKYDALLSAWVSILTDDIGRNQIASVAAYENLNGPGNPKFSFSSRTGYSMKRGRK